MHRLYHSRYLGMRGLNGLYTLDLMDFKCVAKGEWPILLRKQITGYIFYIDNLEYLTL